MLKWGRDEQKGHRMELMIIELWLVLCWLIPIAAELGVRRLLPTTPLWQSVTLMCSFFLNRLLLAPAHTGYYACCRRLASRKTQTAVTCEIEDLREEMTAPTLLRCFFLDYRHPIQSLKWQLRLDGVRFFVYGVMLFPAFVFIAVGAGEETPLMQAVCGAGGVLFALVGTLGGWLLLSRLRPMLYRRPQYAAFFTGVLQAMKTSRKRTGPLVLSCVKLIPLTVFLWCPLLPFRTAFHIEQAALFLTPIPDKAKKRRSRIFHTRVLRET